MEEYLVLAPAEPNAQSNKRIQAFIKLYDQLDDGSIDKQIAETYAEKIYFNDTLVTIHDRQNLSQYLKHTQLQLESIKFQVLTHLRDSSLSKLLIFRCRWFLFRKNPLKTMVIFRFLL
jgi:hypothetical protein